MRHKCLLATGRLSWLALFAFPGPCTVYPACVSCWQRAAGAAEVLKGDFGLVVTVSRTDHVVDLSGHELLPIWDAGTASLLRDVRAGQLDVSRVHEG